MTDTNRPDSGADPRDALFSAEHLMQDLGRRTGNAAVLLLTMSGLRVLQQVLAVTVIARLISPGEYGVYALAMPSVVLAMALSNFGLPQAIIQRKDMTHRLASTLFWLNVLFGLMAMVVVASLSWWAAGFFDEPRLVPVFQAISLAILGSAMAGQYIAIMRRTLRVREEEYINLGAEFLGLGLAVIAALSGLSYWSLVIQQLTVPYTVLALLALRTGWRPSFPRRADFSGIGSALRFGSFVAGYSIVGRLTVYSGTIIIGRLFSGVESGLYFRAMSLASLPRLRVMTPLSAAFVPALSRLQDDAPAFLQMYKRITSRSSMVLMPVAVMIAAGAEPMTLVLLGQQWVEVVPLLFWMSILTLVAPVTLPLHFALLACGRSETLFAAVVVRLLVVCGVMILAAPYGIEWMTAAYMLCEVFISLPILMLAAIRKTPVHLSAVSRAGLGEMLYAVITAGLLIWAEPLWGGHAALVDLIVLGILTGAFYALRIGVDPKLRADALKTVEGKIGSRLRRRR